jgi:hypothetical protein
LPAGIAKFAFRRIDFIALGASPFNFGRAGVAKIGIRRILMTTSRASHLFLLKKMKLAGGYS